MKKIEITDYASFLKSKYALRSEIEFEREIIGEELKKGVKTLEPTNLLNGVAEKIIDSKIGQRLTSAISMVSFVKDLFSKKQ